MSGHSHWATIKHKKAKEDAKRGKVFTKLIKEITVAAKVGGGDLNGNPRLRDLVTKARNANMPQENIMRAIKKGTGELPGVTYEAQTYEGYGPFGIAVIVEALTDNKNRTVAELRHIFSAKKGNLAETGAVSWMFEKMGVIRVTDGDEDKILEMLLDYDIKDVTSGSGFIQITCSPKVVSSILEVLKAAGIHVENNDIEWVAKTKTSLEKEQEEKAIEFLTELEDVDDVQDVYANLS